MGQPYSIEVFASEDNVYQCVNAFQVDDAPNEAEARKVAAKLAKQGYWVQVYGRDDQEYKFEIFPE